MNDLIEIEYSDIRKITEEGIAYEGGNISFETCYENYIGPYIADHKRKVKQRPEKAETLNRRLEKRKAWREVAWRNAFGDATEYMGVPIDGGQPWMLFHTEPPTLVQFDDEANFQKLERSIADAGWATWDSG